MGILIKNNSDASMVTNIYKIVNMLYCIPIARRVTMLFCT
jgi:hypothetical protein